MGSSLDISGQKFGRLLAVEYVGSRRNRRRWRCVCDCGAEVVVYASSLKLGETKSCGCLRRDRSREWSKTLHKMNVKTGLSRSSTYQIWRSMKRRCSDQAHRDFHLYGGRGISVCERWLSFESFLADMGERPAAMSIDRTDQNGHYEPGNCRWATPIEQQNNMRSNRLVDYNGQKHTVSQWSRITGIGRITLLTRLNAGWPVDRALTERPEHRTITFDGKSLRDYPLETGSP